MMPVPVLMVLAFALWTVVLLVLTVGIYRWGSVFAGKAQLTDFRADDVRGSEFYKRSMRAHANCVENLPVFAAVIFCAYATQTASHAIDVMSIVVVVSRIMQSLVHVLLIQSNGVIFLRFCLFLAQLLCFFGIAAGVLATAWK